MQGEGREKGQLGMLGSAKGHTDQFCQKKYFGPGIFLGTISGSGSHVVKVFSKNSYEKVGGHELENWPFGSYVKYTITAESIRFCD